MREGSLWTSPVAQGNNANTRTVSLRIMNDIQPAPAQLAEVEQLFEQHLFLLRTSLAGFNTRHWDLADGSKVRFVSNSGQHFVQLWPVSGGVGGRTGLESLFFAVPSSDDTGMDPTVDPKFSKVWKFRGKTEPPASMKALRHVDDQPAISQHPGNLTWFSDAIHAFNRPIVLSWWGRATRYGRMDYYGHHAQLGTPAFTTLYSPASTPVVYADNSTYTAHRTNWQDAFKSAVWLNGVKHSVQKVVAGVATPVPVMSAGLKVSAGVLTLYVVTHDTKLAVYSGAVGDPYGTTPITVAHEFDIDFEVNYTTAQEWESAMQPLYFNASCTKLAGVVSVSHTSATNTTAAAATPSTPAGAAWGSHPFYAVLCQVDIATQGTSFTTADAVSERTVAVTHTGAMTASEAATVDIVDHAISYGAVDWIGDTLTVLMLEQTITLHTDAAGSWVNNGGGSYDESKTSTGHVRSQWRVYALADGITIASKDTGDVDIGTLSISTHGYGPDPTLPNLRAATGSGSRSETMSADIPWAVSVEGGDLRCGLVVIAEFVETGVSSYVDALSSTDVSWDPGLRSGLYSASGTGAFSHTASTDSRARSPGLRFCVVKDGAVLTTTATYEPFWQGDRSHFGWMTDLLGILPYSLPDDVAIGYIQWNEASVSSAWSAAGDRLLMAFDNANSVTPGAINPIVNAGRPFVNTAAATPDGTYWFYDVGAGFAAREGAWGINGTAFVLDATRYIATAADPILASPVFVDNAPVKGLAP